MSLKFIKNVEDFVCEYCGAGVNGNGFTNHCSVCLWSKHVDIHPGDRSARATCGGMMAPVRVEMEKQDCILTHECRKCGHQKRNKLLPDDNLDEAARIAQRVGLGGE